MIRLEQISKTFNPGEPNEVNALYPLDLELEKGQFTVVIGPNGSGKSTLLNLLAGAFSPSQGRISFGDTDVTRLEAYRRSRWIARMFQDPLSGTAPGLSILDNFRLAALRTSSKTLRIGNTASFRRQVEDRVARLKMGIESQLDRPIESLSGGQRQALTLLMCTMDRLDVMLLDEPAAALDPASGRLLMETAGQLIREEGLTAVLVTHQLRDAVGYGDRLLFMERGRVIRDLRGTDKQAVSEPELYSWFMASGK